MKHERLLLVACGLALLATMIAVFLSARSDDDAQDRAPRSPEIERTGPASQGPTPAETSGEGTRLSVRGRVVDRGATGLVGARVELRPFTAGTEGTSDDECLAVSTDSSGQFGIKVPGGGPYRLSIAAEGYVPFHIGAVDPEDVGEIVLVRTGSLSGEVRWRSGKVAEGLSIHVVEPLAVPAGAPAGAVDAEGRFGPVDLRAGCYDIVVTGEDAPQNRVCVFVGEGERSTCSIVLEDRRPQVEITVVDAGSGKAVPEAEVLPGWLSADWRHTDASGRAIVPGPTGTELFECRYVKARASGYATAVSPLAGNESRVEIGLRRGLPLRGILKGRGARGAIGGEAVLTVLSRVPELGMGVTVEERVVPIEADGRFSADAVPENAVLWVRLRAPGSGLYAFASVYARPHPQDGAVQVVLVPDEVVVVTARVTASDGSPVPRGRVSCLPRWSSGWRPEEWFRAETDGAGIARLEVPVADRYGLIVTAEGCRDLVEERAGGAVEPSSPPAPSWSFEMARSSGRAVRVHHPLGTVAAGEAVLTRYTACGLPVERYSRTEADGILRLGFIAEGIEKASITWYAGGGDAPRTASIDPSTLTEDPVSVYLR